MPDPPLMEVRNLSKHFPAGKGVLFKPGARLLAVDGVDLTILRGESFGLVGESGCGKTTLGRLMLRLIDPSNGRILFKGRDITDFNRRQMRPLRSGIQIIFQDPYSSLDPRMNVASIVSEPLKAQSGHAGAGQRKIVTEILERVGLRTGDLNKYPHEFSGGQRQRIGIARALCVRPELVVADEPVSALDVSIKAQVINLLEDLKAELDLSYLFISHDLSVILHVCDRIAVMYMGAIVETAPAADFRKRSRHPYTRMLLSSIPLPDPRLKTGLTAMEGDVPSPIDPPPGCAFHPRCPHAVRRCGIEKPILVSVSANQNNGPADHRVACLLNDGQGFLGDPP